MMADVCRFDDERVCMDGYTCAGCGRIHNTTGMRHTHGKDFYRALDEAYGLRPI